MHASCPSCPHPTYDVRLGLLLGSNIKALPTVLLKFPVSVVQRAYLTGLKPSGDAVKVEGVLVVEPSSANIQFITVE